ncbi:bi-domain-containing oxidoreductase [Pseudomonas sp. RIT-PI-S]|uniref:bi-domain-containing oxidoreductase n=1 Tax=Pseudomonas sp. RIT-PI-S TaxID=3035295 RepID=UPI0021D9450A|nr:bi-domain-containing oxidoreductase [Pseudomonas sp. RIT-PI-S]
MKQILQSLKTGIVELTTVPCPEPSIGHLLIRTHKTLISAGTERMLVEFGQANLIQKARQQPDKVKMVLNKISTDGLGPTLTAVRNKLDQPIALGYCNVGVVVAVGEGVSGFVVGDRVASNGRHAEFVNVPALLCAKVPDEVEDEDAAFTVLGAIALQGIRLIQPTLGEVVAVVGLGLVGLMTIQLLRAQGCQVIGIEIDPARRALAEQLGVRTLNPMGDCDVVQAAQALSRDRGVDAVIITASTRSSDPVRQAAQMCRKRGRIVLVGVTGLELSRADFYEKELTFQVSCSYGPGRYDPSYEDKGNDYPLGFVRWTEQRNFEAVLDMLASKRLDVQSLISHRFKLDACNDAYAAIGAGDSLGVLLDYFEPDQPLTVQPLRQVRLVDKSDNPDALAIGMIGAGNYAGQVLIPCLKRAGARLRTIVSAGGVSGVHFGRKYGFEQASTDFISVLEDTNVDGVVIATRHHQHAEQVISALNANKHVFVEKPLAISRRQLVEIEQAYKNMLGRNPRVLMVGFNRRFAPHILKMKQLLSPIKETKVLIATVNSGAIPMDSWIQDPSVGGGRIIGEACHFIDLMRYLVGHPIVSVQATVLGLGDRASLNSDKVSFTLGFADGSIGTVHYLANGHKGYPKERLEVFCGGRILQLNNFRKLRGWGWASFTKMNLWSQDKGNAACAAAFVAAAQDATDSPISFEELIEVTRVSIEVMEKTLGSERLSGGDHLEQ